MRAKRRLLGREEASHGSTDGRVKVETRRDYALGIKAMREVVGKAPK